MKLPHNTNHVNDSEKQESYAASGSCHRRTSADKNEQGPTDCCVNKQSRIWYNLNNINTCSCRQHR